MLNEVVGHTKCGLDRNTMFDASMDMLLLSAVAEAAQACVAFSSGWRYGVPIPPGPVTMNDLWNIVPSNPPVSITDLTGGEIREMLEDNLENTFSADPYAHMGGYVKRCLGVNIYAKIENPKGARIQELFVQGEPVRADRIYHCHFTGCAQAIRTKSERSRHSRSGCAA